jgi:7-carboxy-7-deazaguanine synthase
MKIAEIFYSIQGEGSLVGAPSVFVRTSGCNLRCSWCDTPYTSWSPEGEDMTVEQIVEKVGEYGAPYVVLTGGEPMIAPGVGELTRLLRGLGVHLTIETAGTVHQDVACNLMSISPKLSNSTPEGVFRAQHERLRFQPEVLRRLMDGYEYQLKFVIAAPGDVEEVRCVVTSVGADPRRVILMAEGRDTETLRQRGAWLAEICKLEGYRLSPRLHVDLWGDRRGV